jgi:hypothetical protein
MPHDSQHRRGWVSYAHAPKTIDSINTTLRLIEKELIERRRLAGESGA